MNYRDIPFENIIGTKPKSSYPDNVLKEFSLISVNEDKSMPIGSYSYRYARFPGDIDLYEQIDSCCTTETAINSFIREIKRIILNVINKPNHYFLEVKCGTDERFDLAKLLIFKNGRLIINNDFIMAINNLYNSNLLSEDEFKIIQDVINLSIANRAAQLEYETLVELLRKHLILRWNVEEILLEVKRLPGGELINLYDAIKQKSQINIEIITYFNGRFIDMSNFFVLVEHDEDGNIHMINLPQEYYTDFPNFFIEGLKSSVEKLYYSKLNFNPFKMLKRIWSLAKFLKDKNMILKIVPFMSSNVGAINQIKNDLGTLVKIFKKVTYPQKELITKELSEMKDRVSNIIEYDDKFLLNFNKEIDNLISMINQINPNNNEIINKLEELADIFANDVEQLTIRFLKSHGLAPPPKNYLPKEKIYRK